MEGFAYKDTALEEQLDFLKFSYNHVPVGLLLVNRNHIIVSANRKVIEGFGYYWPEDLEGNELHMLVEEEFRATHKKYVGKWFDHPIQKLNLDFRGLKRDGTIMPVNVSLTPYYRKVEMSLNGNNNSIENHFCIASIIWLDEKDKLVGTYG